MLPQRLGITSGRCPPLPVLLLLFLSLCDGIRVGRILLFFIGSQVTIIGYPNYSKGNSPEIQEVKIISSRMFCGQTIYTVGGRLVHGASGGVVLDKEYRVVGIIRCEVNTMDEAEKAIIKE